MRPTAEVVRDGWLTMLEPLAGVRVLDLFAGTGALGLEAISRGAVHADFVETRPSSLHALKANIAALHVRDRSRVFKKDALQFAGTLEAQRYDIAFADPPYSSRMLDRLIGIWMERRFSGILTVEHAAAHEVPAGGRKRLFGETAVTTYTLS